LSTSIEPQIIGSNHQADAVATTPVLLQSLQDEDLDLAKVRTWLGNNKRPESSEIKHESKVVKSLCSQWNHLETKSGLLCRKWAGDKKTYSQVIVPFSERRNILQQCHDARTSGHLGLNKTLERVRERFYWTGLQNNVRSYVLGCPQCRKRKNRAAGKSYMQLDQTGLPIERVATDIMGPLPETTDGHKYILVVSDYFTKWTEEYPLKNIEASTVADVIVEQFISRFGLPEVIHSDQCRQYESRLFKELCNVLGIQKSRTTAFHPKSDGMVERFNKTLTTLLTAYVSDHQQDWDKHLILC
jgi:hypothetical protein